jgi:DNA-directed RNA polymerase subunit beta
VESFHAENDLSELKARLNEIYGEDETIASLSDEELIELGQNLRKGVPVATPVFDGTNEEQLVAMLRQAGLDSSGQVSLFDGRTGEAFDRKVTVGYKYLLKPTARPTRCRKC